MDKAIVRIISATAAVIAIGAAASPASAALTYSSQYDSGGFEAPRFVAGTPATPQPLEGQDLAAPLANGKWFKVGGAGAAAVVQTNNPSTGLQSIRVDRASDDALWAVPAAAAAGSVAGLAIDVDLRVDVAPDLTRAGPLFGVMAYDSTNGIKLIGGLAVDASTGDVLYRAAGTGNWTLSGAAPIARNDYRHFTLGLDYASKTYSVALDGATLYAGGFVDPTATAFSDAPIFTALAGTSGGTVGRAYFDNYAITAVVPEPASLAALAAVALVARRRHR